MAFDPQEQTREELLQEENDKRDQNEATSRSMQQSSQGLTRGPALGGALYATNPSQQTSKDIYNTILRSRLSRVGSNQDRGALLGDQLIEATGAGQGEGTATQLAADRHNAIRTKEVDDSLAAATQGYMQSEQNERQKESAGLQARQFEAEQREKARQYERSQGTQERSLEKEQALRERAQGHQESSFLKAQEQQVSEAAKERALRSRELTRLEKEQREAGGLRERETERRFRLDQDRQHHDIGFRNRQQDFQEADTNRKYEFERERQQDELGNRQREFDIQAKQRATEFERTRAFEEEYAQKKMEQDNAHFLKGMEVRQDEYSKDLAFRRYQHVDQMGLHRDQFTHQIKMDAVNQRLALQKMKNDFALGIMAASRQKISQERADALAERQLNLSLQLNAFDMAARRHQIDQNDWVAQNVHIYKMMEVKMDLERLNQAYEAQVRGEILKANELRFMAVKEAAADQRQWAEAERMHDASLRQYEMQLISAREKRDALYSQISSTEGIAKADRDSKELMQQLGFTHENELEEKKEAFTTRERLSTQAYKSREAGLTREHEFKLEAQRAKEEMSRLRFKIIADAREGKNTREFEEKLKRLENTWAESRFEKEQQQASEFHYSTQDFKRTENVEQREFTADQSTLQRMHEKQENIRKISADLSNAQMQRALDWKIHKSKLDSDELIARNALEKEYASIASNEFMTLSTNRNAREMADAANELKERLQNKMNELAEIKLRLEDAWHVADDATKRYIADQQAAVGFAMADAQMYCAEVQAASAAGALDVDRAWKTADVVLRANKQSFENPGQMINNLRNAGRGGRGK
jgi:hypothetical protein